MKRNITRRTFLGEMAFIAAGAPAARAADSAGGMGAGWEKLPGISLGGLKVSRMILGSNPFFGFAHGNPQASEDQMRQWYTNERIMAVMDEAAEHGVNAVWTPCYPHWIRLWNEYRDKGGKLKNWIGQPDSFDAMAEHISDCARNGGTAICIQGECVDRAFAKQRYDLVRSWLELIKGFGLPAGIASHRPWTHLVAEQQHLPTDFYHQCLYQPEDYGWECLDKAIATIRKLEKPVVAYKVLAAGRIKPEIALPHVFKHLGRKDGICVGVFPKTNRRQISQNTALTGKLTPRSST
ncbi:MAG: hypothetical protein JSU94_11475 [Phycisphaerales bacterium]|nr:MAG: hypothetical protein JSU94_11475 [Phycisphaerales bacterium]